MEKKMSDIDNLQALCDRLSLDEKISLITGEDFWSTVAIEHIGLKKMVLSDGPTGVRGPIWDERDPSLSLPSASSVSASFSHEGMKLVGQLSAAEARRKGVDVVLGPTINLQRSPLGGRHFECYSEDPIYSGLIATEYIRSVQEQGVGGTLKHYVANDSENERFTMSSEVDDATLAELYLKPFEMAVRDAKPWLVMSSYNRINGKHGTDNKLIDFPLKQDWKWDGVVVSDWGAVNFTEESAIASTDLEMPGPVGKWGEKLKLAVEAGSVPISAIDSKVVRILRLAERVGKLNTKEKPHKIFNPVESLGILRSLSADGTVLVKNTGVLPLSTPTKIAVFGGHAKYGREQGGGSATVLPAKVVYPLEGLIENAPLGTSITYDFAVASSERLNLFNKSNTKLPGSDLPGLKLTITDKDGNILQDEVRFSSQIIVMDFNVAKNAHKAILETDIFVDEDGEYSLGMATIGNVEYGVNGKFCRHSIGIESDDPAAYILNPPERSDIFTLKAGVPNPATFTYEKAEFGGTLAAFSMIAGIAPVLKPLSNVISDATVIATENDVSIVFTGTNSNIESEGYDRSNLQLPKGHDELIIAVAKASKKTVVVVNSGSPVEMPWFDEVDAVLIPWFPGQEMGNAIADIIYGKREAGGRMPTSWPAKISDAPVINTTPTDGKLLYSEGAYIGYRGYAKRGTKPLLPFGFGLSYTKFKSELVSVSKSSAKVEVENIGERAGYFVAQIYVMSAGSELYDRRFAGFKKVYLGAGMKEELDVALAPDAFLGSGSWLVSLCDTALDEGVSKTVR